MRHRYWMILTLLWGGLAMGQTNAFYEIKTKTLGQKDLSFADFKGKAVLVVNTASKCGYTKQYDGLEKLYRDNKDKGLVVVGVPSNDFGAQEPGSNEDIAEFCKKNFGVTFPVTEKVVVKGPEKTPLMQYLTTKAPSQGEIKWNFEKFLVNRKGEVVGRYPSSVTPDDATLKKDIEKILQEK